jgi:hypothetical protein
MTQLNDGTRAFAGGSSANTLTEAGSSTSPLSDKVETAAIAAHKVAERLADSAMTQVDQLSGTAHRAVNRAADAANVAAEWAAAVPEQAKQVQMKFTESASAAVRVQPLRVVAGALFVGYLLGRFGR